MLTPESEQWLIDTMGTINKLTPDVRDKAFEPDWFRLRQRFEQKLAELDAERQAHAETSKERNQLANDARLFVPGQWECPKCNFSLSRTSINASTGEFGTTIHDREEAEPCPNDGTPMVRESWEKRARSLGNILEERMNERMLWSERELAVTRDRLRIATEALKQINERDDWNCPRYNADVIAREALKALRESDRY